MAGQDGTSLIHDINTNLITDNELEEKNESNIKTAFITGGSGFVGRNLIRYLIDKNWKVRGIARSKRSAKIITDLGAESINGDLSNTEAMTNGMKGCDVCFHCAAPVHFHGHLDKYLKITRDGTANVIKACQDSQIPKLVHLSTMMVMCSKKEPLINLDETMNYRDDTFGVYSICKKEAEILALNANVANKLEVTILRPPVIWGNDDTTILPVMMKNNKRGALQWINNGDHIWNAAHVYNVVHALYLLYDKSKPGEIYYISDNNSYTYKMFVSDLLYSAGQTPPALSIPLKCFSCFGSFLDCLFCCGSTCLCCECCQPPFGYYEVLGVGKPLSVNDAKIRKELGFSDVISVRDGMLELCDRFGVDKQIIEPKLVCK